MCTRVKKSQFLTTLGESNDPRKPLKNNWVSSCLTPPCDPATETCDEGGDVCEPIGCQSDAECDNGLFCDGAETCDLATGQCQPGTPVDCNDGVSCTVDSCDEAADSCDNAPDDTLCDNGLFCDGAETCDAVNDCQAGTPPCDPATETCDEGGDVCEPIGVDLDIKQLRVTKRVRLSGKKAPTIGITLVVQNGGSVDEPRPAVITGVLPDGMEIVAFNQDVSDPVGDGRTTYEFSYTPPPPAEGQIEWRAEIFDNDPDIDVETATTVVAP